MRTHARTRRNQPARDYWPLRKRAKLDVANYVFIALRISGMKKNELAAAVGVTPQRISKLLNTTGKCEEFECIPVHLLYEIARATGVPCVIKHNPREPVL